MESLNSTFEEICRAFRLKGGFLGYNVIKSGNINDTYTVHTDYADGGRTYLVQRINHYVFSEPEKIISNVCGITEHIRRRLREEGEPDIKRRVLKMYHTPDGSYIYRSSDGGYWRVINYITDSCTFNSRPTAKIMRNTGKAFGDFERYLSDFDASTLYETIPGFHDSVKRFDSFTGAVDADLCGRAGSARAEIEYLVSMKKAFSYIRDLASAGGVKLRVTHNDTKCNNVMFDASTGEPLAVIDLDTVMPGYIAYDFGDAVRFAGNTASEDERDLSAVSLDINMYRQFAEGYVPRLSGVGETELISLPYGVLTVTLELASRFLADYLNGDTYFKTAYEGHNLVRAKCQIKLAQDIERKLPEMCRML
ncbi:MAG: aminoglycoside phosphotransferase family protein [Clostridiales bacterium]|nr:aminoglycoside phosphotransferase family protein [Clostridiales bacterium]